MNDLSDEAFELWARENFDIHAHKPTWVEARRRAEAQIAFYQGVLDGKERKAFEEGFGSGQLIPKDSVYDGASALEQAWLVYQQGKLQWKKA